MDFSRFNPSLSMDDDENADYARSFDWRVEKNDQGETVYITKHGDVIKNIHAATEYITYGRAFCVSITGGGFYD